MKALSIILTNKLCGIKKVFVNRSMIQKITFTFIVSIILSAIVIGFYINHQTLISTEEEIIKNTNMTLMQIKENLTTNTLLAATISRKISTNPKIIDFLSIEFNMDPESLLFYKSEIIPMISYSMDFSEGSISQGLIYTDNVSIPESNFILSESRLKKQDWYIKLKQLKREGIWFYHKQFNTFNSAMDNLGDVHTFSLVKNVLNVDSKHLGFVIIDVSDSRMFSSFKAYQKEGGTIFVLDNNDSAIYNSGITLTPLEKELFKVKMTQLGGNFKNENYLYIYQTVRDLGIKLISRIPTGQLKTKAGKTSRNVIIIVIFSVILLGVVVYLIVKSIFSKLRQIIKIMNKVSEGQFTTRIPCNTADEVGQISNDFNILIEKINDQVQEIVKKEAAQKNAQIEALQYQINPHFIYNMLDTFSMKMEIAGNYETSDAITNFGKMLRYNMSNRCMYAHIWEEIEHVNNYICIQKLRFGEKICFTHDVLLEYISNTIVMKFLLQPIVENSIKHGYRNTGETLFINISIIKDEEYLTIYITDNGQGISEEKLDNLNTLLESGEGSIEKELNDQGGIGIININNRIKLYYGNEYHILLESKQHEYTRAIIILPIKNIKKGMTDYV